MQHILCGFLNVAFKLCGCLILGQQVYWQGVMKMPVCSFLFFVTKFDIKHTFPSSALWDSCAYHPYSQSNKYVVRISSAKMCKIHLNHIFNDYHPPSSCVPPSLIDCLLCMALLFMVIIFVNFLQALSMSSTQCCWFCFLITIPLLKFSAQIGLLSLKTLPIDTPKGFQKSNSSSRAPSCCWRATDCCYKHLILAVNYFESLKLDRLSWWSSASRIIDSCPNDLFNNLSFFWYGARNSATALFMFVCSIKFVIIARVEINYFVPVECWGNPKRPSFLRLGLYLDLLDPDLGLRSGLDLPGFCLRS